MWRARERTPQVLLTKSGSLNPNGAHPLSVPFTKNTDAGTGAPLPNFDSTSAMVVAIQGKGPLVTRRTPLQRYLLRRHLPSGSRAPHGKRSLTPQNSPSSRSPQTHKYPNSSSVHNSDVIVIGYGANGTGLKRRGSTATVSNVGSEDSASSSLGSGLS